MRRSDDFRADPSLAPDERAELSDYRGSGYDRGHMASPTDFKRSRLAMSTTYLLSNMVPQTGSLNRRIWRLLEKDVRELTRKIGEVWVFTGNLFLDADGNPTAPMNHIGANKLAVPTHCFKVIVLETEGGEFQMFGFIMPNQRSSIPGVVKDYQVTVDQVEDASKIDFFSELRDEDENDLESTMLSWPVQ